MPKFKVAVQWLMSDEVEVEADDLDDAMQKADDTYEPTASKTAVLVDDSFEINEDLTMELNEDNEEEQED